LPAALEATQKTVITFPADKQWIDFVPGECAAICVRASDVNGAYSMVELIAAPSGGPPMHLHENEDEIIMVVEGCIRCECEGERFDAPAGTTFVVPRGAKHGWKSLPDTTSRLMLTFTPGGVEGYFEEVVGKPQSEWEATAKKYGTIFAGPPLEL
jgi:quercetin dioxygenase-like cupin family protein